MAVMVRHEPGGTSFQNLEHWFQMMKTGEFKMYDFGSAEKNFEKYGQEVPPFYDTEEMADNIRQIPTLLI